MILYTLTQCIIMYSYSHAKLTDKKNEYCSWVDFKMSGIFHNWCSETFYLWIVGSKQSMRQFFSRQQGLSIRFIKPKHLN